MRHKLSVNVASCQGDPVQTPRVWIRGKSAVAGLSVMYLKCCSKSDLFNPDAQVSVSNPFGGITRFWPQ